MVPKPERVFHETRDPGEFRDFASRLQARPIYTPEPPCRCCGQITVDFLHDSEILLWIRPQRADLRSTRGLLPVTDETLQRLEEWLTRRSIREKILGGDADARAEVT